MTTTDLTRDTQPRKHVALVAHDHRKADLIEWVRWNYETLLQFELICTGTTGRLIEEALREQVAEHGGEPDALPITKLKSGPLGGDQQLGAMIADGKVDVLIFFWDPMEPQPHDVDVKALLRIAVVYNVPAACNRSTADFVVSSPLMRGSYQPILRDYGTYVGRELDLRDAS